ncbi:MAG: hypothetical protein WD534_10535 [Phycisphaeraceae bacterium]
MGQPKLDHLRHDLEIIKQAAGLTPPFQREKISMNLACAGGGTLACLWGLLPHGWPTYWGLLPGLVIAVVWGGRLMLRQPTSVAGSSARDLVVVLVIVVSIAAVGILSRVYDVSGIFIRGATIMGMAAVMIAIGVAQPQYRYAVAGGLPIAVAGLAILLVGSHWVAFFGAGIALGCVAMAMMQRRQLQQVEQWQA